MSCRFETRRDLEQQRALADARFAANKHHAAGYDATAQHKVELVQASTPAMRFGPGDVAQLHGLSGKSDGGTGSGAFTRDDGRHRLFGQRVPRSTTIAPSRPLG